MAANRRLLTALLVAFGAFVLLFAGTGAAAAGDDDNGMTGSYQVAPSHPGDRIIYTLNLIKPDGPDSDSGWAYDAGARLKVERAQDRVIIVDGEPQVAESFASTWAISDVDWSAWADDWGLQERFAAVSDCQDDLEMPSYGDYDDPEDYGDDMGDWGEAFGACWDFFDDMFANYASIVGEPWHVAHALPNGRVLATTTAGNLSRLPGARLAHDLGLAPSTSVLTAAGASSAPCGFHSDLQDGAQPLGSTIHVQGTCPPAGGHFGTPADNLTSNRYIAIGEDVVQGHPATVYGHESGARNLRLWFTADVPYPVRMVVPVLLAQDYPVLLLYEMTDFQQGTMQEAQAPAVPILAPRLESGPDATGVETPFSLAEALAHSLVDQQDTSVAQWHAAHTDAQIDEASFVRLTDADAEPDAHQERWTFTLISGGDAMHVTATKGAPYEGPKTDENADLGPVLRRVPGGTLPPVVDDGIVVHGETGSSSGRVSLAQLPANLPLVADLLKVWQADGAGGGVPAWSFSMEPDGTSFLAVGWAEAVTSGSGPNDPGVTKLSYSYYGVGPDGSFQFAEESPARYDVPAAQQAGENKYDPQSDDDWSDPHGFALASIGYWTFPKTKTTATVAAGAGILGLIAYALMPAKAGALGLFSRIGNDDVLEHPLRAQIADLVTAEPGIHFQELVRRLDAGRGTMEHHLRKLLAADVVSMTVSQGFTCYFPKGKMDRHLMAAAPVLKAEGARQVLQAIQAQPGRAAQDIAVATNLTPSTVNYHLKRLAQSGLVTSLRSGRFTLLTPTPLGTQALGAWGRT